MRPGLGFVGSRNSNKGSRVMTARELVMNGLRIQGAVACLALFAMMAGAAQATDLSNYVELRIYPVQEGRQERFLEFFEEHYLESQEVLGMRIWGQFLDLENAGHFVWLRGYDNMDERLSGLQKFYTSPLWFETGGEAVSMLAGRARHVHFLEPVTPEDAFAANTMRPLLASEDPLAEARGVLVAAVFLAEGEAEPLAEIVRSAIVPAFAAAGGARLGLFQSSLESNNFPMLPFIEDETVVVLFASFDSRERFASVVLPAEGPEAFETFVLEPGRRSRLRHISP
jgi:hypothetical protein